MMQPGSGEDHVLYVLSSFLFPLSQVHFGLLSISVVSDKVHGISTAFLIVMEMI